jgi:hypothetical protein
LAFRVDLLELIEQTQITAQTVAVAPARPNL